MTSSFRLAIWFGPRWEHTRGGLAWFHVIHSLMFIPKLIQEVREEDLYQTISGVSSCSFIKNILSSKSLCRMISAHVYAKQDCS